MERHPAHRKVLGSISGQGTYLGCESDPQLGHVQEATGSMFLTLMFLSLPPLSLKSRNISSGEIFFKKRNSVWVESKLMPCSHQFRGVQTTSVPGRWRGEEGGLQGSTAYTLLLGGRQAKRDLFDSFALPALSSCLRPIPNICRPGEEQNEAPHMTYLYFIKYIPR